MSGPLRQATLAITCALLQPGATFSVGKNDECLITVLAVTDWT